MQVSNNNNNKQNKKTVSNVRQKGKKSSADFNNNMSTLVPSFEIILWALLVLQSR